MASPGLVCLPGTLLWISSVVLRVTMSVKLEGFVKPYRGKTDLSWDIFWLKFLVLAEVSGWNTDNKKMARLLPFLEGDAFLVFSRTPTADQKHKEKVAALMKKSFSVSRSKALQCFTQQKLRLDESVDAFAADLRRLLALSGHKDSGDKNAVVIVQILAGIPAHLSQQVRLSFAGNELTVGNCTDAVRELLRAMPLVDVGAAASNSFSDSDRPRLHAHASMMCFHCGEVGHIRRDRPRRSVGWNNAGLNTRSSSQTACFFCDRQGCSKMNCHERQAWLASKKGFGAAAGEGGKDPCFFIVAASGLLPRVFVDVFQDVPDVECSWARGRSVVDTGSTRTLMAQSFVIKHGIPYSSQGVVAGIVALDGKPIDGCGAVEVILKQTDGPVLLPCIHVSAFVVSNLSAIDADVLVGNDAVAGSGGLSLHYSDDGDLVRVSFDGWDDVSDDLLPSSSADRVTELEKKLALSEQQLSETNCLTWRRDRQT